MEGMIPNLRELHKKLLQAAPLHEDLHTYAELLAPCLSVESGVYGGNATPSWLPRDVTMLKLSLIQILVIKADNVCVELPVRNQYSRVLELLQHAGIEETIIRLLHTSDKVLSHISSKCLSYLVLYQLKYQNGVNSHWLQFCLKTLCQVPGSPTLIPCLTSLLSVCKGFLTDEKIQKADLLLKVLVPLEDPFERHFSTFLTYLTNTPCQPLSLDGELSTHLACLLEFIETLVALRLQLKLHASLCKHVLLVILPQALNIISFPVPYFVKKQIILVLKRCLLCKAGENFLPSPHTLSHQQGTVLDKELGALAGALLGAVQQDWLLLLPVSDKVSSFGGVNHGSEPGPDLVILGATCLSVLKALEIQIHNGGLGQSDGLALDILMAHLLKFLQQHIGWKEPGHACEWVSLTFIEQDDDMLEVAKCLLKMYQHSSSSTTCDSEKTLWSEKTETEKALWNGASHQCGRNPHCIFLFLLSSVSFDSSVLLDFLISSETCFLEYFVRYLKLLKSDWHQFCSICTLFDKSRSFQPSTVTSTGFCPQQEQMVKAIQIQSDCICSPNLLSSSPMDIGSLAVSSPVSHTKHSTPSSPSGCVNSSLGALQRLVDYDSSEDSESESVDNQLYPVTVHSTGADSTDIDKHMRKLELNVQPSTGGNSEHSPAIQQRALRCLEDLQEAIDRLHKKKLFPYNPSALLRLLSYVGERSAEYSESNFLPEQPINKI